MIGTTRYIWTSSGRVHSTLHMGVLYVRFIVSARFDKNVGHGHGSARLGTSSINATVTQSIASG